MYNVIADTIEEYFDADQARKQDLLEVDRRIKKLAPQLTRWFYNVGPDEPGMTFKMVSYGKFCYVHAKNSTAEWPVIGVALQKNYISVYISVTKKGKPILNFYREKLNCYRSGNNNFSFQAFRSVNDTVFDELIREVNEIFQQDPLNPVKFKEE